MDYSSVIFSVDSFVALLTAMYLIKVLMGNLNDSMPVQFKNSLRAQQVLPR